MSAVSGITFGNLSTAKNHVARDKMSDEYAEKLIEVLKNAHRSGVKPNKDDKAKPYRVGVSYSKKWTNFGPFENVEVAALVGTLTAMALYGKKALKGEFDEAVATSHPEFIAFVDGQMDEAKSTYTAEEVLSRAQAV
jgi:hypothetical protein